MADRPSTRCERGWTKRPAHGAMVKVALAPCSPFSVTPGLMRRTAELAEDPDEDSYCMEHFGRGPVEQFTEVGWLTSRGWVAHCIYPNEAEVTRLGNAGVGVAHCPSSNMLLGRQRRGPAGMSARKVLDIATRGGAACLGRTGEIGELAIGAAGDLVCWPQEGVRYAGALTDPIEAWLRCGPVSARHTVVAGKILVRDGTLTVSGVEEKLKQHAPAARVQSIR